MGDVLGYARVSTADQDVAGQCMRLTQAGAIKVFTDIRSGRTMDRPGLDSLLDYAREGDTLAVVRLDRLGRSLGELLATVALLRARGIDLLSLEEKINTASAAGELVFHVFGAIAHFERRLIAERTKDGIAAARARGKRPAAGCRQDHRGAEAGAGRLVANRGGQAGRLGAFDRVSRTRPRRQRTPPAVRLMSRVRGKFELCVAYLATDLSKGLAILRAGHHVSHDPLTRNAAAATPCAMHFAEVQIEAAAREL
jgi:predicted site-specific integrase-resolvase